MIMLMLVHTNYINKKCIQNSNSCCSPYLTKQSYIWMRILNLIKLIIKVLWSVPVTVFLCFLPFRENKGFPFMFFVMLFGTSCFGINNTVQVFSVQPEACYHAAGVYFTVVSNLTNLQIFVISFHTISTRLLLLLHTQATALYYLFC